MSTIYLVVVSGGEYSDWWTRNLCAFKTLHNAEEFVKMKESRLDLIIGARNEIEKNLRAWSEKNPSPHYRRYRYKSELEDLMVDGSGNTDHLSEKQKARHEELKNLMMIEVEKINKHGLAFGNERERLWNECLIITEEEKKDLLNRSSMYDSGASFKIEKIELEE